MFRNKIPDIVSIAQAHDFQKFQSVRCFGNAGLHAIVECHLFFSIGFEKLLAEVYGSASLFQFFRGGQIEIVSRNRSDGFFVDQFSDNAADRNLAFPRIGSLQNFVEQKQHRFRWSCRSDFATSTTSFNRFNSAIKKETPSDNESAILMLVSIRNEDMFSDWAQTTEPI
jgi:hypothetical protein